LGQSESAKSAVYCLYLLAIISFSTSTFMETNEPNSSQELTPKVTGIGGIFFFAANPEQTKAWYAEHLGLEVNQWGSSFEFRNAHRPD